MPAALFLGTPFPCHILCLHLQEVFFWPPLSGLDLVSCTSYILTFIILIVIVLLLETIHHKNAISMRSNIMSTAGAQQMFLNWIRIHMKQYSLVVKHEFGSQIWVCLYHLLVQVWFLIWKMRFKIVLIPWFCLCVCTCILNDYIYKMLGPAHSNHTVNISSTIILHISLILVASKWN